MLKLRTKHTSEIDQQQVLRCGRLGDHKFGDLLHQPATYRL